MIEEEIRMGNKERKKERKKGRKEGRKEGRIAHVQNKEGKGDRCDHAKRSFNKFDGNN
jgi:hypothetical protein